MSQVICIKCGWRKGINKGDIIPTACPYCGENTITPKADALATLLEYFTEDQLLQLAEKCNRAQYASQGNGRAEVFVRFVGGKPRFFGVQTWEEVEK